MNARRSDYGFSFSWMLFLVIMLFLAGMFAFALRWQRAGLEIVSPDNIQMLSRQANDNYKALEAKRMNINNQQEKLDEFEMLYGEGQWPQGKRQEYQQLSSILMNTKSAYNADCARYEAMWNDEWRSIVAPGDLPTTCEMIN